MTAKNVLPDWRGKTVLICASGTSLPSSLTFLPCTLPDSFRLVAINASFKLLPNAHLIYMADHAAVRHYDPDVRRVCPRASLWTGTPLAGEQHKWNSIRVVQGTGLSTSNDWLMSNGNSGFQAINLAYHAGARRVLLLGFDMKLGPRGERHWHPDHPQPMNIWQPFDDWVRNAVKLAEQCKAAGLEVINCTPGSALTAFPRGELTEELARC